MTKQLLSHFDREGIIWRCNAAPSQKLLMLALNHFVDGEGKCYPGVERLAQMMGASAATVKRAIKDLETAGAVKRESRRAGGRQTSNLYTVDFEKIRSSFCTPEVSAAQNEPLNQSSLSPPAAQIEPRSAAQFEPRSIQSLTVQSLKEKREEVVSFSGRFEQSTEISTELNKPIDLVAQRYQSRKLAGRNSDFEKAWTAWQRGRAICKLNPDSGKESAQNAWILRFPTGQAPSNFFADLDAYWAACKKNIEAKKFLPIPGFIKFLGDISYLEAALGESSTTTNPEIEILKTWGDRQDWENFPLLSEWQAKCEQIGWVEFTNLGGRYSPQHRFADWHRGAA